ncbi:MAG: cyclic nucleotide-binding protein [Gemmatimonadetes bacterium]|nr:cyclic nucleotide-binding protein [Gemmatimonadota bacterium]
MPSGDKKWLNTLILFGNLEDQDLGWFERVGTVAQVKAGTRVISAGQEGRALIIILDGKIEVTTSQERSLATLLPGEILGEISLVEQRATIANCTALTDCWLLSVPFVDIKQRLADEAAFAARFYHAIATILGARLRNMVQTPITEGTDIFQDGTEFEGELDFAMMDKTGVAGARFDRLRKKYVPE